MNDINSKILQKKYELLEYNSVSAQNFLSAAFKVISANIDLTSKPSFLDIGCGRGYFLKFLAENNFSDLLGIEPDEILRKNKIIDCIIDGTFENNNISDEEFDIVFTCHALHHLSDKNPVNAIREMLRITKKYIVIIEVNNSNLMILLNALIFYKAEKFGLSYNIGKIKKLTDGLNLNVKYQDNLNCGYISTDMFVFNIFHKIFSLPYSITILEKNR